MLFLLFLSFLKIGLFSFGGGYAAIPLIQEAIILDHKWLDYTTFNDMIALSQMTPGPIGINIATFVGLKLNGIIGSLVATLSFILPSFIIVLILGKLYLRYQELAIIQNVLKALKPVVITVIFAVGLNMILEIMLGESKIEYLKAILFIISFVLAYKYKKSPILIMLVIGLVNVLLAYI